MNSIDILEELKKNLDEILKEPMGKDEMSNGNLYEYERGCELDLEEIQAISNLIAENKELKEKNNELEVINKIQEYRISVIDERELISKSKVKEEIDGKFKEAKGLYERGVQPQAQYTMKLLRDLEQSLLGKE